MLHYTRHRLKVQDGDDVAAVITSGRNLTCGNLVVEFERQFAGYHGYQYGVAVSSGTAALYLAVKALSLRQWSNVGISTMTFAATANAVVLAGYQPQFLDVVPSTLLGKHPKKHLHPKAIVAVDYAGQRDLLADVPDLPVVIDACHSAGAHYDDREAIAACYSFHPAKLITTGEGGMVCTNDASFAREVRRLRNHGIDGDYRSRIAESSWEYDQVGIGFNFRMSEIAAGLGLAQVKRIPELVKHRRDLAAKYYEILGEDDPRIGFVGGCGIRLNDNDPFHLFVVEVDNRDSVWSYMRASGIICGVHYKPVHLHSYYRNNHECHYGMCPEAEFAYNQILTLPLHAEMEEKNVVWVCDTLKRAIGASDVVVDQGSGAEGEPAGS